MRKLIMLIMISCFGLILIGCNSIEEKRAEAKIKKYYGALIEEDYETAFAELFLYEEDFTSEQSLLSKKEAKALYLEKTTVLKEKGYKVKGFEIIEVEYEDGHSFWHHMNIEVEQDGKTNYYKEEVFFHEKKLKISGEDPNIHSRDGKLNVKE